MGTLTTAAKNFVPNFLIAFAIGSYLRDRRTGLKAGLALGVVAAAAAVMLSGRFDDVEEFEAEFEVEAETSESSGAEA